MWSYGATGNGEYDRDVGLVWVSAAIYTFSVWQFGVSQLLADL
jgi:hypothetical protein